MQEVKPAVLQLNVDDWPGLIWLGIALKLMIPGFTLTVPHDLLAVSLPEVTVNDPDFVPTTWYEITTGFAVWPPKGASPSQ